MQIDLVAVDSPGAGLGAEGESDDGEDEGEVVRRQTANLLRQHRHLITVCPPEPTLDLSGRP